jgi:hypothetical protein
LEIMIRKLLTTALVATLAAGCAVRLGGPGPVEYRTVALSSAAEAPAAQVAGYIRESGANVVLLAAPADSAWFAEVARSAKLSLSGPGKAGGVSLAFLAGKPVGDTTLALPLEGGGSVVVHDALYRVDKRRHLDLLALRIRSAAEVRPAVQALLRYVATDVMSDAAVVLAIDVPDAATGESVAALLDPAFLDARTCLPEELRGGAQVSGMRLFYGPEARLRCESARLLGDKSAPVVANLIVGR